MLVSLKPLHFNVREGQVGQESNLQPAVLETAALPIELPTYGTLGARHTPAAYLTATRQSSQYGAGGASDRRQSGQSTINRRPGVV